jgi:phage replication-related protein YjqB (UPF0714/DUF867 family)
MDKYINYNDLRQHEREGQDYVILCREGHSRIALVALHGGGIEPGTLEIADAVAGSEHSFYCFKGIKQRGNAVLHISSIRFDEPEGLRVAKKADIVVSVHGHHGKGEEIFVGGKDRDLKERLCDQLLKAGFKAVMSTTPGQHGQHLENICNRCGTGKGIQLEISRGLREKLFDNLNHLPESKETMLFNKFINCIKESLR